MANPPFNIKDWWHASLENDVRWKYGTPPKSNANFAWIQHMLYHLNDNGSMALLLANGSMSSNTNNEGEIRKALIEADLVECMVALPGQLFTNTQIPACIWFLTKNKAPHPQPLSQRERGVKSPLPLGEGLGEGEGERKTDRRGKTLFIDARNLGYMKDRVLRDFTEQDIAKIADTFHAWQTQPPSPSGRGARGEGKTSYQDEKGFCYSASLDDIKKHDYVLTPGRYVGATDQEEDSEPFAEKMARLTKQLKMQFEESDRLEGEIKKNLLGLGYDFT
jgi:type I restriction enzyme M protein